jgi:SulP family sulfate permease
MVRELGAGAVVAALSLPFCVTAGVLVYLPLGPTFVAQGAFAGILCAVTGGIAAAVCRRSSFVTTIPTTPTAVIQASILTVLAGTFGADGTVVLAALPFCIFLAGLWQILFALTGLSRVFTFAPYPVVSGFVTGVSVLILLHQLPTLVGVDSLAAFGDVLASGRLAHPGVLVFGLLMIFIMALVQIFTRRVPVLLLGLIVGTLLYQLMHFEFPQFDVGTTVGAIKAESFWSLATFNLNDLTTLARNVPMLRVVVLGSLTLAIVGTLDTLLALRAAQQLANIAVTPRRDIIGQGVANLVAAATGGLMVSTSLSLTAANYQASGRTRVSTIASALVLLIGLLFFPGAIAGLPVVVLAAILVVSSFQMGMHWSLQVLKLALVLPEKEARKHAQRDSAIVLAVVGATVFGTPIVGAAVGFALSCLVFIVDMSRPVVARRMDGTVARSKRVRSNQHNAILHNHGDRIAVFELQGVLFFGNADYLANELRELPNKVNIVILDLHRVTDVDTSGAATLKQIANWCRTRQIELLVSGSNARWRALVGTSVVDGQAQVLFSSIDGALDWAEEQVLHSELDKNGAIELALEKTDLVEGMAPGDLQILLSRMERVSYAAGELLCSAGDDADRLWILLRGAVSIRAPNTPTYLRLAGLGPGCCVGEMGVLTRQARSANVIADDDVEAYVLTAEAFRDILRQNPRIGEIMLLNIAKQLAQRLRNTSQDVIAEAG